MAQSAGGFLISGTLYKKRGGLGRHAKQPWQPRQFALSDRGVLSYFESAALEKARGSLNLVNTRAVLSTSESVDDAPTRYVLILSHTQGQRWKLSAESAGDLESWREKLEPFCRGTSPGEDSATNGRGAGGGRPAATFADRAAAAKDGDGRPSSSSSSSPGSRLAERRSRFERRPGSPFSGGSGLGSNFWVLGSLFVCECVAVALRGGGFAVASFGALALLNVYATLVVVRKRDEAPSETLVSLIVPPAALPPLRVPYDDATGGVGDPSSPLGGAARRGGPRAAGATGLTGVAFSEDGDAPCGTWSVAPGSTFKIRQKGYAKTKRKAPSDDAFYEAVAVDFFDTEARVMDMASKLALPEPARPSPDPLIPALYVVNAQIPSETGPMRVKHDADGHGYQMVIVMQLAERTCADLEALKAGGDAADAVPPGRRAALDLLRAYCRVAPDEGQLDAKERGRFKVLAQIRNIDEVNIPNFAKGYNGKPALINKTGTLNRGPSNAFHNMDINIHAFGYMARSGLQSIFRDFQDFILSVGFVLEGRAEAELPECMLCALDLNHVDFNMACAW